MFIYKNITKQEYDSEQRAVLKDYQSVVINPMREVARIELKGNRQRKIVKVSNPKFCLK